MFKALVNWRRRNRAIRELSKLSDLELADLGIVRREIAGVVRAGLNQADETPSQRPAMTWVQIRAARQGFINAGLLSGA